MPSEIRLWQIRDNQPNHIAQDRLDLESRLEDWLRDDISMIADENTDLLVIGQQVPAGSGIIDLLAMDKSGDLVILELKRDKTSRDIIAQVLDYASWIQGMGHNDVIKCASDFFKKIGKNTSLERAFRVRFGENFPEVINESHRIFIVASSLDSTTERIVKYLSETYGVDINVATFTYFKIGDNELIGRSMLLDEEAVQTRSESRSQSKRKRRNATEEELREVARKNGVEALWDKAIGDLYNLFNNRTPIFSQSTMTWYGRIQGYSNNAAIIGIVPGLSSVENGIALRFGHKRVVEYFDVSESRAGDLPSAESEGASVEDYFNDYFFNSERLDELIALLSSKS